ncbi:terpene synthase family protein [Natrinema sp. SYSU A 869]|uniref:terpene synthase family protein n=1 Tax=Natrinema sp. SYSU A 869 TaxID=2871694 RepID=UPI001CA3BB5E|nr:terpene synthase family protein [Natrinema sp. SYSU A 869]
MNTESKYPTLEVETDPFSNAPRRTLSETVRPLADAYDERIADRDRSTWRWFDTVEPEFRLSCVDDEYGRRVRDAKVLATMFITVIDDVAERHGDRATLKELLLVPFDSRPADPTRKGVDGTYVRFQQELWDALLECYAASPRADEFADLFRFDVRQALQSVDYSALLAQYPGLAGERELRTYDVYNMMLFPFADIDFANALAFEPRELSTVRDVVAHGQRMARIGNWIATWERELAEGDYSSGVVIRALESEVVSHKELRAIRTATTDATVDPVVDRIRDSGIEAEFVDRWCREYEAATEYCDEIESIDVRAYLEGFEPIFRSQLARRPSA